MRYLIDFALLLPMVVFAEDPPLPEALLNAKTVFVEKVGTAEASFDTYCKTPKANAEATDKEHDKYCKSLEKDAKADKQLFDRFCKVLKKWGRFTLVQDRSSADVRILLSGNTALIKSALPPGMYGTWDGKTYRIRGDGPAPIITYELVSPLSREKIIIKISDRRNNVLLYSDQLEGQRNDPGKLVSHLKKRMKQK